MLCHELPPGLQIGQGPVPSFSCDICRSVEGFSDVPVDWRYRYLVLPSSGKKILALVLGIPVGRFALTSERKGMKVQKIKGESSPYTVVAITGDMSKEFHLFIW